MNNHPLVEEPSACGPDSVAAVYDDHAADLFKYCWFMLRNTGAAQVALRDSLIVADAHSARLSDPAQLRPWLYAVARAECARRRPSPAEDPGTPAGDTPEQGADPRLMARHAVMAVSPLEREALELSIRHDLQPVGVAAVLGMPAQDAKLLLIRARESLEQALAGEILLRTGGQDCPERAAILKDLGGILTAPARARLLRHAARCAECGQHLPHNVSATKVHTLLSVPEPPGDMRGRVLACFTDPELAGYRAFVAGRAGAFDDTGFPVAPPAAAAAVAAARPRRTVSAHLWVGLAAAVATTAVGVVFAVGRLGGFGFTLHGTASGPQDGPAPGAAPGAASGTASRTGTQFGARLQTGLPITATTPLGVAVATGRSPASAPSALPSLPSREFLLGVPAPAGQLQVQPGRLDLGRASSASIVLRALTGTVAWSASTSSPQVALSGYAGTLPRGGEVALRVIISRISRVAGAAGQATILIGPGNVSVPVTWSALPGSSPPSGTPSAPPPGPASGPPPSPTASAPAPGPSATPSQPQPTGSSGASPTTSPPTPPSGASGASGAGGAQAVRPGADVQDQPQDQPYYQPQYVPYYQPLDQPPYRPAWRSRYGSRDGRHWG